MLNYGHKQIQTAVEELRTVPGMPGMFQILLIRIPDPSLTATSDDASMSSESSAPSTTLPAAEPPPGLAAETAEARAAASALPAVRSDGCGLIDYAKEFQSLDYAALKRTSRR